MEHTALDVIEGRITYEDFFKEVEAHIVKQIGDRWPDKSGPSWQILKQGLVVNSLDFALKDALRLAEIYRRWHQEQRDYIWRVQEPEFRDQFLELWQEKSAVKGSERAMQYAQLQLESLPEEDWLRLQGAVQARLQDALEKAMEDELSDLVHQLVDCAEKDFQPESMRRR